VPTTGEAARDRRTRQGKLVLKLGVSGEGLQQGNHSVASGRLNCALSSSFQFGHSFADRRILALSHGPFLLRLNQE
jgi:hypothetical protein